MVDEGNKIAGASQRKTIVVDASIALNRPNDWIHSFDEHILVVPLKVKEQLRKISEQENNLASWAAKKALGALDEVFPPGTNILDGVPIQNKNDKGEDCEGIIKIAPSGTIDPSIFEATNERNDNHYICSVAKRLSKKDPNTIMVTKNSDINDVCQMIGVKVEDYKKEKKGDIDGEVKVFPVVIDQTQFSNEDLAQKLFDVMGEWKTYGTDEAQEKLGREKALCEAIIEKYNLRPNQYFVLKNEAEKKDFDRHIIFRANGERGDSFPLIDYRPCDLNTDRKKVIVVPRSLEQRCTMDLFDYDNVKIAVIIGFAGTGKTYLAIAYALERMLNKKPYQTQYEGFTVIRPAGVPIGEDLGYLPGNKQEKIVEWTGPISNNLKALKKRIRINEKKKEEFGDLATYLLENEIMSYECIQFMRGMTIPNRIIILDDAQNLTADEMKTLIQRLGDGSKLIILGDTSKGQIDRKHLDSYTNGLADMTRRWAGKDRTTHRWSKYAVLNLQHTTRSDIAAKAVEIYG